jgi:hypothetical protein
MVFRSSAAFIVDRTQFTLVRVYLLVASEELFQLSSAFKIKAGMDQSAHIGYGTVA